MAPATDTDVDDAGCLIIPVPAMIKRRASTVPTWMYELDLPAGGRILVAETHSGYVGLPLRCPHKLANLRISGAVDPTNCVITCQADLITFSLETGQAVRNVGAQGEETGTMQLFEIRREGENFILPSSSPP